MSLYENRVFLRKLCTLDDGVSSGSSLFAKGHVLEFLVFKGLNEDAHMRCFLSDWRPEKIQTVLLRLTITLTTCYIGFKSRQFLQKPEMKLNLIAVY